ncbi:MAG: GntR family transcriptional regulator [Lentisphaeria bacterium]|nr:GntR family transcriptional regulator [Lentisphaeria bacterium]
MNPTQCAIYENLLESFLDGTFREGDLLPGERLLAKQYGTTVMNAKGALSLLARRNLVKRIRHAGTFVRHLPGKEILRPLKSVHEKLSLLLCSANPTNIHWDKSTVEKFSLYMEEKKFRVLPLQMPVELESLREFLLSCASLSPENVTVLDDNFDHRSLYALRELFRSFPCPVVRLNRNGASCPLNTPNTVSLDLDHFRNGFLAAQEALKKSCSVRIVYGVAAELARDRESFHAYEKEDGLRAAFLERNVLDVMYFPPGGKSLAEIEEQVRENPGNTLVIALNSQFAALLYDHLAARSLFPPKDYLLLSIEIARQYEKYRFGGIVMPREKTGELLAKIACGKNLRSLADMRASFRMEGFFVPGKTF